MCNTDKELRLPLIRLAREVELATMNLIDIMSCSDYDDRDKAAWKVKELADRLVTVIICNSGGG